MATKKTEAKEKALRQKHASAKSSAHDHITGDLHVIKDFVDHDLSYSGADISNISHLQKIGSHAKNSTTQHQVGMNSSGILSSPYSNILKSTTKSNNILDQLMNSNAGLDFTAKPSSLIFESNVRNFGHKRGASGNDASEEEIVDGKIQSSNVLGDFLLSSPFYNPLFNNNDNSPISNTTNNQWNHNLDLFKTPLKTPVLNVTSNLKSGSSFPMTALKLSINQQSSVANPMLSVADINSIHPMLNDNNQSPIVTRRSAIELRREKKRRLKIEVNNQDDAILGTGREDNFVKPEDDLSSEATVDLTAGCVQAEDELILSKESRESAKNTNTDTDDYEKSNEHQKILLSPMTKNLKKSGNILPKNRTSKGEIRSLDKSKLPRMGSFSTHSQSRMASFNNSTVNTSINNHYQHHFTNDSTLLGNNSSKRNTSILSNSSQLTTGSFYSQNSGNMVSGSIKKQKKKKIANSNSGSSSSSKKYQIVLKFPDTFT